MSDAFLTDDHTDLRRQVRDFAEAEVAPAVTRMETAADVERDLAGLIARQGWIGATIPSAYGGMDAGHLAKTLINEELSRVSGAMGAMAQASQLGTAGILHFGNDEQKHAWLPRIADGSCLPTIAVTEGVSGGHVLGMEATGRRKGRRWILTGRKIYIGNSHIGHVHKVVVRTGKGSRGLTAFLVEADRPGIGLAPLQPALGLRGFSFGELVLDDVRIPETHVLGEVGDGLAVAYSSSVLYGRPNLTALALGIQQAAMDQTLAFATGRRRYGRDLAELPTIRQQIGRMESWLRTSRLTAYHAAHQLDQGRPCDADLINAKHVTVQAALDTVRTGMDIHAAAGLLTSLPMERYLRDAHHINPPAGTSDIQLLRLAEEALGVGKGQWSQRLEHSWPPRPVAVPTA